MEVRRRKIDCRAEFARRISVGGWGEWADRRRAYNEFRVVEFGTQKKVKCGLVNEGEGGMRLRLYSYRVISIVFTYYLRQQIRQHFNLG